MGNKNIDYLACDELVNRFKNHSYEEQRYMLTKVKQSVLLDAAHGIAMFYEEEARKESERVKLREEKICYT